MKRTEIDTGEIADGISGLCRRLYLARLACYGL